MRTVYFLVVLIALFLFTNLTAVSIAGPISIPGLFNTGVDNQGARLPDGSLEQHYSLTGVSSTAYVFHDGAPDNVGAQGAWATPAADAMWIGPSGGTMYAPDGDYIYTLTFDLSGFNPADVAISGQWSSDNSSAIYLNGVKTQYESGSWGFFWVQDFSIDSGFLPTINTLEFHVNNEYAGPGSDNPTGLLVQNLSATPEPATLCLLGLGGLILRKRKA
jgi:hypothetical protein